MKTEICERLGIEFPIFAFSHCRDVVADFRYQLFKRDAGAEFFEVARKARQHVVDLNGVGYLADKLGNARHVRLDDDCAGIGNPVDRFVRYPLDVRVQHVEEELPRHTQADAGERCCRIVG